MYFVKFLGKGHHFQIMHFILFTLYILYIIYINVKKSSIKLGLKCLNTISRAGRGARRVWLEAGPR